MNSAYIKEREVKTKSAGEVQSYFLPESFTWHRDAKDKTYVAFRQNRLYISARACVSAGFRAGDQVEVGENKAYFAIRSCVKGFKLSKTGGKSTSLYANVGTSIADKIVGKSIDNISVVWDDKSKMLVGRKPENRQDKQENGQKGSQANTCQANTPKGGAPENGSTPESFEMYRSRKPKEKYKENAENENL